jgi:integrase
MQANTTPARRVRVNGRRSIYYRDDSHGKRRYEITYYDSDGRRRWKTVDGGLRQAEALLDDLRSRVRRGEKVAPTKATVQEVAEQWLASKTNLRPRTREGYETSLRVHVFPRLGKRRISVVDVDDIAALVSEMRVAGKASATIVSALKPVSGTFAYAARLGLRTGNPVRELERDERPKLHRHEMRVLSSAEIAKLLEAASSERYRVLVATAIFSGLRQGELLGLQWRDVDFRSGTIRVRQQLDRDGTLTEPKTPQARRHVVLMPALAAALAAYRLSQPPSMAKDDSLVFASRVGTPMTWRNASRRGLGSAVARAGLPHTRFHDLRHTFASLLIAEGLDITYIAAQLGHANPTITLSTYAHVFDRHRHEDHARSALEARFGTLLSGTRVEPRHCTERDADASNLAQLRGSRT